MVSVTIFNLIGSFSKVQTVVWPFITSTFSMPFLSDMRVPVGVPVKDGGGGVGVGGGVWAITSVGLNKFNRFDNGK